MKLVEKSLVIKDVAKMVKKGDLGRLWFDIETYKEPVKPADRPVDWPDTKPGVPLRCRMKLFMVCVSYFEDGDLMFRVGYSKDEAEVYRWFDGVCEGSYEAAYCSHNNFDRLVMEGKWTTARRNRLKNSGCWPNLVSLGFKPFWEWVNVWHNKRNAGTNNLKRGEEIGGLDIVKCAEKWDKNDLDLIAIHCLRDVAGCMLEDGDYDFDNKLSSILTNLFSKAELTECDE